MQCVCVWCEKTAQSGTSFQIGQQKKEAIGRETRGAALVPNLAPQISIFFCFCLSFFFLPALFGTPARYHFGEKRIMETLRVAKVAARKGMEKERDFAVCGGELAAFYTMMTRLPAYEKKPSVAFFGKKKGGEVSSFSQDSRLDCVRRRRRRLLNRLRRPSPLAIIHPHEKLHEEKKDTEEDDTE